MSEHGLSTKWSFAVFYEVSDGRFEELKCRYLHFLSGQSQFTCCIHSYPLTSELKSSGKVFCFREDNIPTCNRSACFSCPSDGCAVSVCRNHFQENPYGRHKLLPRESLPPFLVNDDSDVCDSDPEEVPRGMIEERMVESDVEDVAPELGFLTDASIIEKDIFDGGIDSTDSGPIAQTIEWNAKRVNMNLFLAVDIQPLRRKRGPNNAPKTAKRIAQNLVATSKASVPITSMQAMLAASSYFISTVIGSYPGAIPSVLMKGREDNEAFEFDGIEEHARIVLRNHELAVASNQVNQSLLFDIIVNRELSGCHAQRILRGGLTELTKKSIDDRAGHLWDISQCQRHVRELSACFRENPPKLFVTLTCNMREHFGVRKVFNTIDRNYFKHFSRAKSEKFRVCSTALRDSVMQSSLALLTRCWERALRYILHIFTKCHVLGTVQNY